MRNCFPYRKNVTPTKYYAKPVDSALHALFLITQTRNSISCTPRKERLQQNICPLKKAKTLSFILLICKLINCATAKFSPFQPRMLSLQKQVPGFTMYKKISQHGASLVQLNTIWLFCQVNF